MIPFLVGEAPLIHHVVFWNLEHDDLNSESNSDLTTIAGDTESYDSSLSYLNGVAVWHAEKGL